VDLADEVALLKSLIDSELDYFTKTCSEHSSDTKRELYYSPDNVRCSLIGLVRELGRVESIVQKMHGGVEQSVGIDSVPFGGT
jgi:hypothetical protein